MTTKAEAKRLVAETNRLLYMEGLVGASGHVSVCNADEEVAYLNPFTASRGEIRPEDVVAVTYENDPMDPDAPPPVSEAEIHTVLYRSREDVGAVLHVHPPVATLFGITGTDLVSVSIRGSVLDGPVPVLDRPDKITDRSDSDPMIDAMGDANQLLIRGHGAVVADRNIKRAFARAIYVERNATYQLNASVLGNPNPLSPEEVARLREQNWTDASIDKRWHYYRWKARKNGYLPKEW
jgi:L-fuculose-phosphate aldolase